MMQEKARLISISETLLLERITPQTIFRRRAALIRLEMMHLRERQMYCLIDEKHSLEEIASILRLELQEALQHAAHLMLIYRCIEPIPMEQR